MPIFFVALLVIGTKEAIFRIEVCAAKPDEARVKPTTKIGSKVTAYLLSLNDEDKERLRLKVVGKPPGRIIELPPSSNLLQQGFLPKF